MLAAKEAFQLHCTPISLALNLRVATRADGPKSAHGRFRRGLPFHAGSAIHHGPCVFTPTPWRCPPLDGIILSSACSECGRSKKLGRVTDGTKGQFRSKKTPAESGRRAVATPTGGAVAASRKHTLGLGLERPSSRPRFSQPRQIDVILLVVDAREAF
jgi:hypothetical protein